MDFVENFPSPPEWKIIFPQLSISLELSISHVCDLQKKVMFSIAMAFSASLKLESVKHLICLLLLLLCSASYNLFTSSETQKKGDKVSGMETHSQKKELHTYADIMII